MSRMSIYLIAVSLVFTIIFCSCSRKDPGSSLVVQDEKENARVELTEEQLLRAGIKTGYLEFHRLIKTVQARGLVVPLPDGVSIVSSFAEGIITDIYVGRGYEVNAGEALCRIRHPEILELQENYLRAYYEYDLYQEQFFRIRELAAENVSSKKAYQKAIADYEISRASLVAASERLSLMGIDTAMVIRGEIRNFIELRSPIKGKVNDVYARLGSYVEMNKPLFEIVGGEKYLIELKVFEEDAPLVREGQNISFSLSNYNDFSYQARIISTAALLDPDSKTLKVMATFENKDKKVFPGMFVASRIAVEENNVMALPESALVRENDNSFAFIVVSHNEDKYLFEKQALETGLKSGGYVEILYSSLPEDAQIVLDGAYYLNSQLLKELE